MLSKRSVCYVPTLRFKQGEYLALRELATDVADRIVPRLVIPPLKDRDPEEGCRPTKEEILLWTGRRIGRHWPMRPAFLDPHFLLAAFGDEKIADWLPRLFGGIRGASGIPIPVADLEDMNSVRGQAFQLVLSKDLDTQLAVRIQSGEVNDDLAGRVDTAMSQLGIVPENCALLLDFADADFSDVEAVASVASAALEDVQAIGLWRAVVFQGTNFPDKNPAAPDSSTTIPRNEWLAWRTAVQNDPDLPARLIFGDYGADSARFKFQSGGISPIPHYRYCIPDSWLVVRGGSNGCRKDTMQAVSRSILDSGKFAGRDFSWADEFIYGTANGHAGPGNASTWRQVNTVHHITHVVSEIGLFAGFGVERRAVATRPNQASLFGPEA